MRINYFSDLHLEMGSLNLPLPEGEIMVLAGDITLAGVLDPSDDLYHQYPEVRRRSLEFFDEITKRFERVFYIPGNHEPYHYNISQTPRTLAEALPKIEILNDTVVDLGENILLVGGTLWTDIRRGNNNRVHDVVTRGMNDFQIVYMNGKDGERKFTTHDAVAKHRKTRGLIDATAAGNPNKTIVVATHHAPSFKGINPLHGGNTLDAGYATNMDEFIRNHRNISHWIFGHTHIQKTFKIGHCEVVSNARGYVRKEASAVKFKPDTFIEVKHDRPAANKKLPRVGAMLAKDRFGQAGRVT